MVSRIAFVLMLSCGLWELVHHGQCVLFLDEPLLGATEGRPSCLDSHLGLLEADRVERGILREMNTTFVKVMEKFLNASATPGETSKSEDKKKITPQYKKLRIDEHVEYTKDTVEEFILTLKKLLASRTLENKNQSSTEPHPFEHIINTFQFVHRLTKDTRELIKNVVHYENSGKAFRDLVAYIRDLTANAFCSISEKQSREFKQYLVLSWEVHGLTFEDFLAGRVPGNDGKPLASLRGGVSMQEAFTLLPALCQMDDSSFPSSVVQTLCLKWSAQSWSKWSKELEKPENLQLHRSFTRQYSRALAEASRFTEALKLLNDLKAKYSDSTFTRPIERDISSIKDKEERQKQSDDVSSKHNNEDPSESPNLTKEAKLQLQKMKMRDQFWTNFTADSSLLAKMTRPQALTCFYYIYPRQPVVRYRVEILNKRKPVLYQIYNVIANKEVEEIKKLLPKSIQGPVHEYGAFSQFYQQHFALRQSNELKKVVGRIDLITRTAVQPHSTVSTTVLVRNSAFSNYEPWNLFRQRRKRLYEEVQGSTCLMFLSDAYAGGQVYFPDLKLSLLPQKGSVLFWYDDVSEDGSKVNLHEPIDIPLLVGSKWVGLRRVEEVNGGTCAKKA